MPVGQYFETTLNLVFFLLRIPAEGFAEPVSHLFHLGTGQLT
jgi:hypothetical protein